MNTQKLFSKKIPKIHLFFKTLKLNFKSSDLTEKEWERIEMKPQRSKPQHTPRELC